MDNCLHAVDSKLKSLEESTQALKLHRNTLVPISRLSTETLCTIFSLLPPPIAPSPISHVCHRSREISLNLPYLWRHIDFTKLTPAGANEMLARAKLAPLHLENEGTWNIDKFGNFRNQIRAHIHHIRHFSFRATHRFLAWTIVELSLPAPSLELLSIANRDPSPEAVLLDDVFIPNNLFDGIAPKLSYLRLDNCAIRWTSPLLKGLRDLTLVSFPPGMRTTPNTWLDALNQMPQLERLSLRDGIPIHSLTLRPGVEPELTVQLPSLTELDISALAWDCMVVLAHLVLPTLARLCVNVQTEKLMLGREVRQLLQYVSRNAYGPQDTEPLRSLFIGGNEKLAEIIAAWTMPRNGTDEAPRSSVDLFDWIRLARVEFSIMSRNYPTEATGMPPHGALLTRLPLTSIASLTVKGHTPLTRKVWRTHAPRWHKLKRVCLFSTAVPAFRERFEDAQPGGNLFRSLEELVLVNVFLDAEKVYYLYNMLIKLVELKIPLRKLDLRTCTVANRAVRLLRKIVGDVQGLLKRESGDVEGKRLVSIEVLGEEGGADEEEDRFDDAPPSLGSWDAGYDDDDDDDFVIDSDSD